jgi:hypothetical protein
MERARTGSRLWRRLAIGALVLPAAADFSLAKAEGEESVTRSLVMRASAASGATASESVRSAAPKLAADPGTVTANACTSCGRDAPPQSRALLPALPPGESYDLRILKSAVNGFTFRLSGGDSPTSPDERVRIRVSRQKVGVYWQRSF